MNSKVHKQNMNIHTAGTMRLISAVAASINGISATTAAILNRYFIGLFKG